MEVNILFLANNFFISLQSEKFQAKWRQYFQKEPNINLCLRLVKIEAIHSEYLLVYKNLQANICFNRNFAKFCKYSLQNKFLKWIIPSMRKVNKYLLWSKYSLQHVFVLHQIEYLYVNFCEYFKANDVNKSGDCEYAKTCEWDPHLLRFALKQMKKVSNTAHPILIPCCFSSRRSINSPDAAEMGKLPWWKLNI
jgi:hypothetical protein